MKGRQPTKEERVGFAPNAPLQRGRKRSQRFADVSKEIETWLNAVIRNYYNSDPGRGKASEPGKLELARQTIECWWYLYKELMLWAQSHIVGYEWALRHPESFDKLLKELKLDRVTEDSHLFELIGIAHVANKVNPLDPVYLKVEDVLESLDDDGLDDVELREIILELHTARSTESSFWRFPLQQALRGLNLGEVLPLFEPENIKRQGSPTQLQYWKARALSHVYFLVGKGMKKRIALEQVGSGIGQSVETLRTWEKEALRDEDRLFHLHCAQAAGEFERRPELTADQRKDIIASMGLWRHRNMDAGQMAGYEAKEVGRLSLDDIRNGINSARRARPGDAKIGSPTRKMGVESAEPTPRKGRQNQ
jgi:hypothetical protein